MYISTLLRGISTSPSIMFSGKSFPYLFLIARAISLVDDEIMKQSRSMVLDISNMFIETTNV